MFQDGFFTAAGEALFLMLIAAILGFLIAWFLRRSRYEKLLGDYNKLTGEYGDLNNRHNALQTQYEELKPKYQELQTNYDKQARQLKECTAKRAELDLELTQFKPFKAKYESLQADFDAKSKEQEALQTQYKSLEVKSGGFETALKEERDANRNLAAQVAILQKQLKEPVDASPSKEVTDAKVTAETAIPLPVADIPATPVPKPKKKKETQEEALERIKQKVSNINFDRIGVADIQDEDDLKRVKGIGPFIEKKLKALGIYTWRQIANFTAEDEDVVNDAIEFFPGRIRRDNWSSQAEGFADEKDKAKEENNKG